MFLLDILKKIFQTPAAAFDEMGPETFLQKKRKMYPKEYGKWLSYQYTYLGAILLERKEKRLIIPRNWLNKFLMLEKEMENFERETGIPLFSKGRKKLSEELEQYGNIKD